VGNNVQIIATENRKEISFSTSVHYPKSGSEGLFAPLVGLGILSIPAHHNVATMNFNTDAIAQHNSGGRRNRSKLFGFNGPNRVRALIACA
jgi:hypothetical protein